MLSGQTVELEELFKQLHEIRRPDLTVLHQPRHEHLYFVGRPENVHLCRAGGFRSNRLDNVAAETPMGDSVSAFP